MPFSIRRSTPFLLLLLAVAALFEPWLPAGMRDAFGPGTVARVVAAILCLYVLILVVERERMASDFKQVLKSFQEFHAQQGKGQAAASEQQKREAIEILITALESKEPDVKKNAHAHLRRLTGQELGPDAEAWRAWLARR